MKSVFALGHRQVRRSGYGAMQLAGQFAAGTPPDRPGTVNALIREALYPYPDNLAIVSKVAGGRDGGGAGNLRAGIEENLRSLQVTWVAHLRENLAADDISLDDRALRDFDQVSA